jgi:hypothetical protein
MAKQRLSPLRLVLVLLQLSNPALAQQAPDSGFRFANAKPAFTLGTGPRVCMDVAHKNFQSAARNPGAYQPLAELLQGDGYRVWESHDPLTAETLRNCDLLVVAAAYGANDHYWSYPRVSAFTRAEITSLYQWLRDGGSLFLTTDHTPAPGAAAELGEILGVVGLDGLARLRPDTFPDVFARARSEVFEHAVFRGRGKPERVDSVATFHGQAFRTSNAWSPLLQFGAASRGYVPFVDLPRAGWPQFSLDGWLHAAARRVGKGRVVWLGEVSTCTALRGPLGMNHPSAAQNAQFCLNITRWLSGLLDD